MGIFTRSVRRLPPTIFGYQPPPGATAGGWQCTVLRCGESEFEPDTRRWPRRCPACGAPIASRFLDDPWAHEAKRVELDARHRSARDEEERASLMWEEPAWWFAEALRLGDRDAGRTAQVNLDRGLRAWSARMQYFIEGNVRWKVVTRAIDAGWSDEAAAELVDWFDAAITADVENDNARRTNCRQLVDRATFFLESPQGQAHSRHEEIYEALSRLVYAIREVMTADGSTGFARLRRIRSSRGLE